MLLSTHMLNITDSYSHPIQSRFNVVYYILNFYFTSKLLSLLLSGLDNPLLGLQALDSVIAKLRLKMQLSELLKWHFLTQIEIDQIAVCAIVFLLFS